MVYFDKPIDAIQSSLNAVTRNPDDLAKEESFEKDLGTDTWKATADICENSSILISYEEFFLPKFTIKDPSTNTGYNVSFKISL